MATEQKGVVGKNFTQKIIKDKEEFDKCTQVEERQIVNTVTIENLRRDLCAMESFLDRPSGTAFTNLLKFADIINVVLAEAPFPASLVWGIIQFCLNMVKADKEFYGRLVNDIREFDQQLEFACDVNTIDLLTPRIQDIVAELYTLIFEYSVKLLKVCKDRKSRIRVPGWLSLKHDYDTVFASLKTKIAHRSALLVKVLQVETLKRIGLLQVLQAETTTSVDQIAAKLTEKRRMEFTDEIYKQVREYEYHLSIKSEYRLPGTCLWIDQQAAYQQWLRGEKYLFWQLGQPGVGKTTLVTRLITEALAQRSAAIYCLCEHDQDRTLLFDHIVRAFCYQMFQYHHGQSTMDRLESLISLFDKYHGASLAVGATRPCFQELLDFAPGVQVTFYIDGLDEAEGRDVENLLSWLWSFLSKDRNKLRIFLSSRHNFAISHLLESNRDYYTNFTTFTVTAGLVTDDIKTFVAESLKLRPKLTDNFTEEKTKKWEEERLKVISDLPVIAKGHFQWASLIVSEMNECLTRLDVENLLRENYMPKSLYQMYSRIIFRLEKTLGNTNFAKAVILLRWCACSVRPLRLEEVIEILKLRAVVAGDGTSQEGQSITYKETEWTPARCKKYEDDIRKICGCLIHFRPSADKRLGSSTLHFIHLSAKEFLTTADPKTLRSSKQAMLYEHSSADIALLVDPPAVHGALFWDCVTYLMRICFQERLTRIRGDSFDKAQLTQYPFFDYAATTWPLHLRKSGRASIETSRARLQIFFESANLRTWMEGAVALKNGLEWLHMIRLSIDKWLSQSPHAQTTVPAFENWGNDIASPSFMDYEATLLHNTNEVHFLDRRALFPHSIKSNPFRFIEEDEIQEKFQDLGKKANRSATPVDNADPSEAMTFPANLFIGESGDNSYGYIAQDLNVPDGGSGIARGILLLDHRINHPRLVWERLTDTSDGSAAPPPTRMRLASVIRCSKLGEHDLWTTISAAINADGTALSAVFSERHPQSPGKVYFKTVIWQFEVTEKRRRALKDWRDAFYSGNVSHLPQRPAIPSTEPAEEAMNWTTAFEVRPKEDVLVDENGIFADSKNLVAFHTSGHLLTPSGIIAVSTSLLQSNPWGAINLHIQFEATVVPGGERVVGFKDSHRQSLAIVPLLDDRTYGELGPCSVIQSTALTGNDSSFEHIVACSESGTHICLTMRTAEGKFLVGVLRLEDEYFEIIFQISLTGKMRITHCIFDRGRTPPKQVRQIRNPAGESSDSETARLLDKKRPNELQFVAFVVEETSLVEAYTLLAYSLQESCLLLQTPMPGKPEGLLFFQSPNSVSLISLANGRRATQHSLQVCEPPELTKAVNSRMDAEFRVLNAIDFDLTPSGDGKCLGYTFSVIKSSPQRDTTHRFYVTNVTIRYWKWQRMLGSNDCVWVFRLESCQELASMHHLPEEVQQHGIALSQDLGHIGFWMASTLIFFSASPGFGILQMKDTNLVHNTRICTDLRFNSLGDTAASLWRCSSEVEETDYKWEVRVHQLAFDAASTTATIALESNPQALAFHPSENILSVSSVGELQILRITSEGSTQLLHKISSGALRGSFEVHKDLIGPASPQPTEPTAMAHTTSGDDFDFQYSCCSQFLFNQSWNRFVDTEDIRPETGGINLIHRLHEETSHPWTQISAKHPCVMKENRLYAAGQQRFKIFKIRSYLVLGWSADGTNLWDHKDTSPTWYRRVVCAIPLSLGNWRATLIWPKATHQSLTVLLYPPESFTGQCLPVSIGTSLQVLQMDPKDPEWLKGHASGCPYHLGVTKTG